MLQYDQNGNMDTVSSHSVGACFGREAWKAVFAFSAAAVGEGQKEDLRYRGS